MNDEQMFAQIKETLYKIDREERSLSIRRMFNMTQEWENKHKVPKKERKIAEEFSWERFINWCDCCAAVVVEKEGDTCKECKKYDNWCKCCESHVVKNKDDICEKCERKKEEYNK